MCETPCIFPQNREAGAETGSQMTASTARFPVSYEF
jgi:hypothetical protein